MSDNGRISVSQLKRSLANFRKYIEDTFAKSDHTHSPQVNVTGSSGSCTGNSATASKLNNSLTIQGNGTSLGSFDGSSAKIINITSSNVGAASSSHTHNYAGSSSAGGPASSALSADKTKYSLTVKSGNSELGTFNGSVAKTINITPDSIGAAKSSHALHVVFSTDPPKPNGTASVGIATTVAASDHVHPLQTSVSGSSGSCTGNSATASKLATARKISLTGNLSGSTTFDGSGDVSISVTIPTSANGDFFGGYVKVNVDGVMEIGKHVDFHNADDSTDDYNTRITCTNTGTANVINLPTQNGTIALTSDISSAIGNINKILDEINGVSL